MRSRVAFAAVIAYVALAATPGCSDGVSSADAAVDAGPVDAYVCGHDGGSDGGAGSWMSSAATGRPSPRFDHTAVWTGTEMIIWGGWEAPQPCQPGGGAYNPATDSWRPIAESTLRCVYAHTAVWTGSEMIVFSGNPEGDQSAQPGPGGRYDPISDTWTLTSLDGAPELRWHHSAVWTGTEMLVWGGSSDAGWINTGGRYDPATDTWRPMSTDGAPVRRGNHTAVWTGSEMVVWGGWGPVPNTLNPRADGGRYDPATDRWRPIASGGPRGVSGTAIWTGTEMIVWGEAGGRYDPVLDEWRPVCITSAPDSTRGHTAIWTGTKMIIWGGRAGDEELGSGGIFDPVDSEWTKTKEIQFYGTAYHSAVWTSTTMVVFGGVALDGFEGLDDTMVFTP